MISREHYTIDCTQGKDGQNEFHVHFSSTWSASEKGWLSEDVQSFFRHKLESLIKQVQRDVARYMKESTSYYRYYKYYVHGCGRPIYDEEGNFLYYRKYFRHRRGKRNGSRK